MHQKAAAAVCSGPAGSPAPPKDETKGDENEA